MTRARDLAAFVSNADGDVKFDTDTLFIDSSANRVGIGNTAPDTMIHGLNATAPVLKLERDSTSLANNNIIGEVRMSHKDSNDAGDSVRIIGRAEGTAGAVGLAFTTGTPSGGAERMRINQSGNVHITDNTNGPDSALHIEKTTPQIRLQLNGNSGYNTIESGGSNELIIGRSGTEQLRVLSGGGLTFNGDTAAANALSDYEEGTYEHTATCTTSGTITVAGAFNTGSYVKIGNMVTAHGLMVMSAVSSPAGVLKISLPFATKNGTEREFDGAASVVINNTAGNTVGSFVALFIENDNHIYVYEGDASAYGNFAANQVQSSSLIWYSATYRSA